MTEKFAVAAGEALRDTGMRRALRLATASARDRRADAVAELPDWEALRDAGSAIRRRALLDLDALLTGLEAAVTEAGGRVRWAGNAASARRIVEELAPDRAVLAGAVLAEIGLEPCGDPAEAACTVTGADFLVAETGTVVVLADPAPAGALVAVAGIEQVVARWRDLEVLLQLWPRSAGGSRMNPVTTMWTGIDLVLLDNGRTRALGDPLGREALTCIRCTACSSACPVYERVGAGPYGGVLPGPIGAVLTPLMHGIGPAHRASLPFASTLCGACADVCPVRIDLPGLLVMLRARVVESRRRRPVPTPELALMRSLAWTMSEGRRYEQALAQTTRWARVLSRNGTIKRLPGLFGKWTEARDLPAPPRQGFRAWWRGR
ncbi:4Fe-4S dicluster domain-containing protein [Actinocorallia longicatena]|uniref:4Fe-4S ferredoxin-type domain-containing protein n=1 Tax=Actinocorallia longicatena TaxID=111803 RepID=A0ABP6PV64_9ACTN